METDKILVELPKFVGELNLDQLHDGKNVFINKYFSIIIVKNGEEIIYYAMFNTPKLHNIYDFVVLHKGPRNRYNEEGIQILENHSEYSFIPLELTDNLKKMSYFKFKWHLYHALK